MSGPSNFFEIHDETGVIRLTQSVFGTDIQSFEVHRVTVILTLFVFLVTVQDNTVLGVNFFAQFFFNFSDTEK